MKRRNLASQRGFTLVEIMVVLIIISILMTVLYSKILGAGDRAKANITNIKMSEIGSYIEQYRLQYNHMPSTLASLVQCTDDTGPTCVPIANADTNVNGQPALVDGWGKPFVYSITGDGRSYTIKSFGADGIEGGSGINGDIVKQGP